MSIKEEIFREFIRKLECEEQFPKQVLIDLLILWEEEKLNNQNLILEIINKSYNEHD